MSVCSWASAARLFSAFAGGLFVPFAGGLSPCTAKGFFDGSNVNETGVGGVSFRTGPTLIKAKDDECSVPCCANGVAAFTLATTIPRHTTTRLIKGLMSIVSVRVSDARLVRSSAAGMASSARHAPIPHGVRATRFSIGADETKMWLGGLCKYFCTAGPDVNCEGLVTGRPPDLWLALLGGSRGGVETWRVRVFGLRRCEGLPFDRLCASTAG